MDVGEPPAVIAEARKARVKRLTPIFSSAMGVGFGLVCGYISTLFWPGATSWTQQAQLELFGVVAAVVGVAEFYGSMRLIPWVANASIVHVRRVAVLGDKLRIDPVSGNPIDYPLKDLRIGAAPEALDWYTVSLVGGRAVPTFYVPGAVASELRNAIPHKP